jgi:hypothetical protein
MASIAHHKTFSFQAGNCTLGDYDFSINAYQLRASLEGANCKKPIFIVPDSDDIYELLQFHIHLGCENHLDKVNCDAEMHIVHAKSTYIAVPRSVMDIDLPDLAAVGLTMNGMGSTNKMRKWIP